MTSTKETTDPRLNSAVYHARVWKEIAERNAAEIQRLHTVIRAAREELEHGGGGEAEAFLVLKHSGVS